MRFSPPTCNRKLRHDQRAVSEVFGFALTLGIVAIIAVLAMIGFNDAKDRTEKRIGDTMGQTTADQVASAVIEASELVRFEAVDTYSRRIALSQDLVGMDYTVSLGQSHVWLNITQHQSIIKAPLVGAGSGITLCTAPVAPIEGALYVKYGSPPDPSCSNPSLFLEEA